MDAEDEDVNSTRNFFSCVGNFRRKITVEPVMFFVIFADCLTGPLKTNLIMERVISSYYSLYCITYLYIYCSVNSYLVYVYRMIMYIFIY